MATGRASRFSLDTPAEGERLSGKAIRYPYRLALAGPGAYPGWAPTWAWMRITLERTGDA
jgi:hypothetical protein